MDREIKFRAWTVKGMSNPFDLEYIQDLPFPDPQGNSDPKDIRNYPIGECLIMQSTGLYDKNGVEIFEGDIVKYVDVKRVYGGSTEPQPVFGHDWVDQVLFEYGSFTFKNVVTTFWNENLNQSGIPDWDFPKLLEVIGNIYENKELIK